MKALAMFTLVLACAGHPAAALAADFALDTAAIEQAAGAKGTLNDDEGVFKVTYARNDILVVIDGTVLPPFMGLTSWAAFMSGTDEQAMVMGDIVLFQDEVNQAMSAALDSGLEVTSSGRPLFTCGWP